jgi:hypothetical protein
MVKILLHYNDPLQAYRHSEKLVRIKLWASRNNMCAKGNKASNIHVCDVEQLSREISIAINKNSYNNL